MATQKLGVGQEFLGLRDFSEREERCVYWLWVFSQECGKTNMRLFSDFDPILCAAYQPAAVGTLGLLDSAARIRAADDCRMSEIGHYGPFQSAKCLDVIAIQGYVNTPQCVVGANGCGKAGIVVENAVENQEIYLHVWFRVFLNCVIGQETQRTVPGAIANNAHEFRRNAPPQFIFNCE